MRSRSAVGMGMFVLALGGAGSLAGAFAQGAPFTIRQPPDGATVREKVRVEIPRASIPAGGFVAFYLDNTFYLALAPDEGEKSAGKPFTLVWNTKDAATPDGPHSIRAVLFEPAAGTNANAVNEKGSSEVKVTVANKISTDPGSLQLRYRFREGENLEYSRTGKTVIVGGISETGTSSDQEIASVKSKVQLSIEDERPGVALVRNKLTELSILMGEQETTLSPSALSASMYQELSPEGRVLYETGTGSGLAEFSTHGLPVDNTLELPLLPSMPVSIGMKWETPDQRLDVPGLPPSLQPKVTLQNTLEGLEWENGYPTAKIRQTYNQTPASLKTVLLGPIEITSPKITYDRVIYVAYKSGTLVKTTRTLTIAGRTTSPLGASPTPSGAGAPAAPGAGLAAPDPAATGQPGQPGSPAPGSDTRSSTRPATRGSRNDTNSRRSNPPRSGFPGGFRPPFRGGRPPGGRGRGGFRGGSLLPGDGGQTGSSGTRLAGYGGQEDGGGLLLAGYGGGQGIPRSGRRGGGKFGGGSNLDEPGGGFGGPAYAPGGTSLPGSRGNFGSRGSFGGANTPQETDHAITVRTITETELLTASK